MLSISLYSFLFAYFAFLAFFAFFLIIELWHLTSTGTFTLASFWVTFFVLAFAALALWATWLILQDVNWQQPVVIWNNAWLGGVLPAPTP